ncbi:MAG: glycosyltransferase family 1 protein [Bacteroidota bacterium]
MKIAINTRLLIKNKLDGIGWFTFETLNRITKAHPEHTFYFIFDRSYHSDFTGFSDNIIPVVLPPQARHPLLFYIWFEWSIPFLFRKIKPDIFVSPDGYISLSTKVPTLAVIHDLNFEHYPKDLPWLVRCYYRHYFPLFAEKANRIVTVSEFSKQDIVDQYHISADKVDVVYNGASEFFCPIDENAIQMVRNEYSGGKPYFLFVGALHPRKNLINLLKAFDLFRDQNETDIKLLVVGERKWWTEEMEAAFSGMKWADEVIFINRMDIEKFRRVVAAALAQVYVSYFEGFGIPIIEAFNCNVPVITSNVTSMPEVAGDAAILIDPFSVNSIADGLSRMAFDHSLRDSLIEKGKERRKLFDWNYTAEGLWKSIEKTFPK